MKKVLVCAGMVLGMCGFVLAGEHPLIEVDGRYWMPNLEASVRVVESDIGAEFNAKDDLGVDDENFPDGRIIWNASPNSRIRLGYTQIEYSGSQDVTRSIDFNGQTYSAGTLVESELKLNYIRLGWIWQFINMFDEKLKLGPIVEAKGIMAEVSLDAPNLTPAVSESEEFAGGLPTAGLALDIAPIEQVNLFCEASGLYVGDYGYFLDAEAGVEFKPIKYVSIIGGYRIIDMKIEDEPSFANVRMDGPFAGGKINF